MYTFLFNGAQARCDCSFVLILLGLFFSPALIVAQEIPTGKALEEVILKHDSLFWVAYNKCDVATMTAYVAEDLEFYHDKGGKTNTRVTFEDIMRNGLCRSGNNEIERRPVAGSIKVFPIAGIGAIIRGQHTFHGIVNPGDNGIAYFFHLWEMRDGEWVMSRVFSYDHKPY